MKCTLLHPCVHCIDLEALEMKTAHICVVTSEPLMPGDKAVLSKVQNRGSPNGPPMVDGWVVHITFGWSVYVVVRNDDKTLIMTFPPSPGPVS